MNIHHVNHASLFIQKGEYAIFTDPWVDSDAFTGWEQSPKPNRNLIEQAVAVSDEKCLILISHGHDDHFDDYFIKENFPNCTIMIAKFRSPGVRFRAQALTTSEVIEVDDTGINWNGFEIKAYINDEYTGDDAIFTIADQEYFLVHANDNWHSQPSNILSTISNDASQFESAKIAWCSQVGIAGSWPIYYEQYSFVERTEIIKESLKKMLKSGFENAVKIGASYQYLYANQSQFKNKVEYLQFYHRDIWIEELVTSFSNSENINIEQLFPGSKLFAENTPAKDNSSFNVMTDSKSIDENFNLGNRLTCRKLKVYEEDCNDFLRSKLGDDIRYVAFYEEGSERSALAKETSTWEGELNIVAEGDLWEKILTGEINIECMTIGGLCGIYKKDREHNLRDIHICLSNFGYKYQAIQKRKKSI